jgi:hypothetical protein
MKTVRSSLNLLSIAAVSALVGCATTHDEIAGGNPPSNAQTSTTTAQTKSTAETPKLPPGWTQADMQACMEAATPGKQQQNLARATGKWTGTTTMWMAPDTQPMTSPVSSTVSTIMDGRFTKCEFSGEMPGMGPFQGFGFDGYDNAGQKYVSTWLDNMGTGIMFGEGTMSADGSTLTWSYHMTCPITKKATTLREVRHFTGDNKMTFDMYGDDPHTGKEFHSMHIELTRQSP